MVFLAGTCQKERSKGHGMSSFSVSMKCFFCPRWIALVLAAAGASCSSVPSPRSPFPKEVEIGFTSGDGRVGTYVSSWKGFRTSSYWIEGPEGLVFIDTQFLPSAAEEMIALAEQGTGKKAVLAIVLHPNPDKFNGTAVFQKRGIRVITSSAVLSRIPAVHQLRLGWFFDQFKPDYPSEEPRPESYGDQSVAEIKAAGLTLKARSLGPGCSAAHVVIEFEGHAFVGDLVTQGFHSWLELGLLDPWLSRLSEIKALRPRFVHTGRGGSGGPELLDAEELYLKSVQKIIAEQRRISKGVYSEQVADQILGRITGLYPSYFYPKFVENGIEESWKNFKR